MVKVSSAHEMKPCGEVGLNFTHPKARY